MRILFVTLYDAENNAVRALMSQTRKHGHDAYMLQLKQHTIKTCQDIPSHTPLVLYYVNGNLMSTDPKADPITKHEQALYMLLLDKLQPDVVGFSMRSIMQNLFPMLTDITRKAYPQALRLAGGVGPTLTPEFYLQNGADVVIRGEAEDALVDFLDTLDKKKNYQSLKNVAYLKGNELICNPLRPLEKNLSRYPIPWYSDERIFSIDQNTFDEKPMRHSKENIGFHPTSSKIYHCVSSRGCLGACSYCAAGSLRQIYQKEHPKSPKMRMHSVEHFLKELHEIKQQGAKFIFIADDIFMRPIKALHKFLDRYAQEIAIPFSCYFHPYQLLKDDSLIKKAIHAGCVDFIISIQHACPTFCRNVYNRKQFVKNHITLCERITAHGGNIRIQFIGGNPLETHEGFSKNADFIKTFPYDDSGKTLKQVTMSYLMHFEGSQLQHMFPRIRSMPRSIKSFVCNAFLLDIRHMTTDKHFEQIINDECLTSSPENLKRLRAMLLKDNALSYLFAQIDRLKGKEVFFWGCGDIYTYKKHLFAECQACAIILDKEYIKQDSIDGIPVLSPDIALSSDTVKPIIIFSQQGRNIFLHLRKEYPRFEDIVICNSLN